MSEKCSKCEKGVAPNDDAFQLSSGSLIHQHCMKCDHCLKPFDVPSFVPVNNKMYHSKCYESLFLEVCSSCNGVIDSKYFTWKGKKLHSECFKCPFCKISLQGQQFTEVDGNAVCVSCSQNRSRSSSSSSSSKRNSMISTPQSSQSGSQYGAPQGSLHQGEKGQKFDTDQLINCPVCSKKIFPHENSISIHSNKAYHQSCLKCDLCHSIFDDGKFYLESGRHYHRKCLDEINAPKCDKCKKSMKSYVPYKDVKLHAECFTCFRCSQIIGTQGHSETPEGNPLCRECERIYNQSMSDPKEEVKHCHICDQVVTDGIIIYGHIVHRECFSCASCRLPLRKEEQITETDGHFFHVNCIKSEYEEKCDKCGRVLSDTFVTVLGSKYHEECINCASCGCSLTNIRFSEKEGSLYCKNCLPSHRIMDTESKSGTKINSKSNQPTINAPEGCCPKCLKKVYMIDEVVGPRATKWHRACLVCAVCRKYLDATGIWIEGNVYCTSHARRK